MLGLPPLHRSLYYGTVALFNQGARSVNRRGRPKKASEPVNVRLPDGILAQIDELRRVEPDVPTRPEMIRRLIEKALETSGTASSSKLDS